VGTFGGILVVLAITLLAGGIAYVGDRVGHQVGRKRLTLFGLRPKYTSTIVAVGTGMVIALAVTVVTLIASNYARSAFFHLTEINNKLNALQAQADELDKRVHETNVVVYRGELLYGPFLLLQPSHSAATRLGELSAFFDAVVENVNRSFVPRGLKRYRHRSSDPDIQKRLRDYLADERIQGLLSQGPVLLIAAADENLFVNDEIHFEFVPYLDKLVFTAHQIIAGVEVDGGTNVNPNIAFNQVVFGATDAAISRGMPSYYVTFPRTSLTKEQAKDYVDRIRLGKGRFRIVARAQADIYPHTGGLPIDIDLIRSTP
jgi:hypothetical protein